MTDAYLHSVRVYYEDTDTGGIVYYANYLKFAERARTEILRSLDINQSALIRERNLAFAVRSCQVEYLKPAILDDELQIRTHIAELSGASVRMKQEICRNAATLVTLDVKLVCVNTKSGRPSRWPKELTERFGADFANNAKKVKLGKG